MSKGKKRSGARPGRPQPLRGTKGKRKGARLWYVVVNNFNCRGFGPLLEDKLCLIFKLAPSVCRMTFPILASLLVRLVVLLPFQLLRLSLATPSRWTPLALSVFLHCVVVLLLSLLYTFLLFMSIIVTYMMNSGLRSLLMVLMPLLSRLLTLLVLLIMPLFLA